MFQRTVLILALGLCGVCPAHDRVEIDDAASLRAVIEHLQQLESSGERHMRWRTWHRRGDLPEEDWERASSKRTVEVWALKDEIIATVEQANGMEVMHWRDGVMTVRSDRFLNLSSREPRIPGRFHNVWDLAADILYRNPGRRSLLLQCLEAGQILGVSRNNGVTKIDSFIINQDLVRFSVTFEEKNGLLCLKAVQLYQAVTPVQDRAFEDRVLLTHEMRVVDHRVVDGIRIPVHALMETRSNPNAIEDPEVQKFWRDQPPSQGRWVLDVFESTGDDDAWQDVRASLTAKHGDAVTDQRLGLTYMIGEDWVERAGVRYQLPLGEKITELLDASMLDRLDGLLNRDGGRPPSSPVSG